ncbi:MAG: thioredoxin family protein [Crocinitomix sp.]|nr:thioredoxin family protein [Crocinitomix sp.]
MALVESNPFEIGTSAPAFSLLNVVTGQTDHLTELKGVNGTVIMFICNHCPFVIHVNEELIKLANDYHSKGINFIAISSNDLVNYPQDGPAQMKTNALSLRYLFPYLYDETQEITKAYNAACTPDFYIFNPELKSTYHGQLDDSRPGNNTHVTGIDIRNTIDALLYDITIEAFQKPSIGCSIKWK